MSESGRGCGNLGVVLRAGYAVARHTSPARTARSHQPVASSLGSLMFGDLLPAQAIKECRDRFRPAIERGHLVQRTTDALTRLALPIDEHAALEAEADESADEPPDASNGSSFGHPRLAPLELARHQLAQDHEPNRA